MRQKISKSAVDALKAGQIVADSNPVGFVARRLPSGAVTYGFRYRDKATGRQRWIGLGVHGDVTPDQARKKALKVAGEVKDGSSPVSAAAVAARRRQAAGYTVDGLLDNFLERYARPKLRSANEIERCFRVYVRPRIGSKSIYDLRRNDIVGLLDTIEDAGAPVMADRTLAHLRRALNWYATRDDQFAPPIVKGMSRARPAAERARSRILVDDEIVDLWTALDALGEEAPACFPSFVRALFLTATRRAMVSDMTFDEIEGRSWTVPGSRNKGGRPHLVPLTDTVTDLLGPKRKGFIFSSDGGRTPFSGFSKAKAALEFQARPAAQARRPQADGAVGASRSAQDRAQPYVARRCAERSRRARTWPRNPWRARHLRQARVSHRETGCASEAGRTGRAYPAAGRKRCFVSEDA